jgi:hypothetical protein
MERILLVEPEYSNKYPPLGLMKIASYHKNKNDKVEFYKGKAPYTVVSKVDKVYITTLFTFYYDITIDTIKHYMQYINADNIYVGGIASTLLYKDFKKDTGLENIIVGQLINSSMVGYTDNENIDELPLDYDILDDISYNYPAGDNFFVYTTRGCPRKCEFCAVSTLEPEFKETNHIIKQITDIREKYGDKRNVLIMDNNILFSSNLKQISDDLLSLQFMRDNPNYRYPNPLELRINKINRRREGRNSSIRQEEELIEYLINFKTKVKGKKYQEIYQDVLDEIIGSDNRFEIVVSRMDVLCEIIDKYRYKKLLQRYVDFNQGADARLLSKDKMKLIKNLPIKPFRLAYDHISETAAYVKAFEIAYKNGVRHFSNYILYNYKDKPEDLWNRLHNSIVLYEKKFDLQAFSFPMKYTPIGKDREFTGQEWNKKYLSAINIIINVTNGVVAKEKDFFYKAYGKDVDEFLKILTMPNEFIKYRFFFEKKGYISAWEEQFINLNAEEKECLINILSGDLSDQAAINDNVSNILAFYRITKHMASGGQQHFPLKESISGFQIRKP